VSPGPAEDGAARRRPQAGRLTPKSQIRQSGSEVLVFCGHTSAEVLVCWGTHQPRCSCARVQSASGRSRTTARPRPCPIARSPGPGTRPGPRWSPPPATTRRSPRRAAGRAPRTRRARPGRRRRYRRVPSGASCRSGRPPRMTSSTVCSYCGSDCIRAKKCCASPVLKYRYHASRDSSESTPSRSRMYLAQSS
jgi:hypothetical protein